MAPYVALTLSTLSVALVLGFPPLPTGIWPGITLGLFGLITAGGASEAATRSTAARWARWAALLMGLGAALFGLGVYLGVIAATGQVH